jgi:psiF repeat
MKAITALAALAIVGAGPAVAAGQPAAPTATPVRHPSLKVCNKQADAKQLTGEARSQYLKDCHAGRSAGKPATKSADGSPGKSS